MSNIALPGGRGMNEPMSEAEGLKAHDAALRYVAGYLAGLEREAESMPLDEVIGFLDRAGFEVSERRGAADNDLDPFTVSHGWTEKGLRRVWARARLQEEILEAEDKEEDEKQT